MTTDKALKAQHPIMEWYLATRRHYFIEASNLGCMTVLEYAQPEGGCRTPLHDSFQLHVPLKCAAEVAIYSGSDRPVRSSLLPGQMLVARPQEEFRHEQFGDTHGLVFVLPAERVTALATEIQPGFAGHFGHLHEAFWRDNRIRDLALGIWRTARGEAGAPDNGADEAMMSLVWMLLQRAERGFAPRELDHSMSPGIRRRVMVHVEENIAGDCSLFALASVAGLSPFHFARAFRRDVGDTPHRYVARRRVARAREMIVSSPLGLAEIAQATGFSSQSRMTEAFVRTFGVTPGRVRAAAKA
jgi:AraC family transcriptional regulator